MDLFQITDGVVRNVICADSIERALEFYPDSTFIERVPGQYAEVEMGWLYDGTMFHEGKAS